MGISIGFSDDTKYKRNSGTPDPYRFEILESIKSKDYWLLKVRYPDCVNYNGIKILVINYKYPIEYITILDPHFLETSPFKIIARFEPTIEGWQNGMKFLDIIS